MNTIQTLVSTLALAALPSLPAQLSPSTTPKPDEQRLADAINLFAADLHGRLAATDDPTCSPASVSFALLMLLPGARGNTAAEIAAVLRLPSDLRGEELHSAAQKLLQQTLAPYDRNRSSPRPQLRLATDFWGQKGHEFVPEYGEIIQRAFGAKLHQVDFENDCEGARRQINKHIADATNQRIRELLPPGAVTPTARTVLSNAIWYRGKWMHDFYRPEELSKFHVSPDRTVDASMMHVSSDFWYAESEAWQAVTMPFQDRVVAFELIVPRPGHSLAVAERALLGGDHRNERKSALVQVSMPAFRVRSTHPLRTPLEALGMRDAFDNGRADFTGIDASQPLNIDQALHGTWIDVDEHGVEAAAATVLTLEAGAAIREEPEVIVADRPFAFALRDRRTGLLLFVGRVTDPTGGS